MVKAKQADLAKLFERSQQWVSKVQKRGIDPMPLGLDGARAWGHRLGLLGASGVTPQQPRELPAATSSTGATAEPLFMQSAVHPAAGSLELSELRLKTARADLLENQHALQTGKLMRIEDADRAFTSIAAEFRHVACEYPLRARAVLERHIVDSALVENIFRDLQPLAAQLLNKADARQVLRGKSRDEIRAVLEEWLEKVTGEICAFA